MRHGRTGNEIGDETNGVVVREQPVSTIRRAGKREKNVVTTTHTQPHVIASPDAHALLDILGGDAVTQADHELGHLLDVDNVLGLGGVRIGLVDLGAAGDLYRGEGGKTTSVSKKGDVHCSEWNRRKACGERVQLMCAIHTRACTHANAPGAAARSAARPCRHSDPTCSAERDLRVWRKMKQRGKAAKREVRGARSKKGGRRKRESENQSDKERRIATRTSVRLLDAANLVDLLGDATNVVLHVGDRLGVRTSTLSRGGKQRASEQGEHAVSRCEHQERNNMKNMVGFQNKDMQRNEWRTQHTMTQ